MLRFFHFITVFVLLLATSVHANSRQQTDPYELQIIEIIELIHQGKLSKALTNTEQHLEQFPKSRVGFLLKADILQAMSGPLSNIGAGIAKIDNVKGLKKQLANRWRHYTSDLSLNEKVPANLIDMGDHAHVIVADMAAGRLYLYKNDNNRPQLIRDYYLTVGSKGYGKQVEGDNKTPIGVYSIYRHIPGAELPDLYGKGAYPVNYPNRYDRALKRTGYGIWLHGTPSNTYARAPWASEGCFVLSNNDLLDIEQYIDVKNQTPVILSDSIEWISLADLTQRRKGFYATLQQWQQDWESLDTARYLSHYSKDNFNFGREKIDNWAAKKQAVNLSKTFVQVDIKINDLFIYPGKDEMFVVHYRQRYLSNNYVGETEKEQYWQKDKFGKWKIIYES